MQIVLEGIDNSGKTTLAFKIKDALRWPIKPSEGPPKYKGELDERTIRYLACDCTIFDRHPIISNPLYEEAFDRDPREPISPDLVSKFWSKRPLLIYCEPNGRGLTDYQTNFLTETPEHLAKLHANYHRLLDLYRTWALEKANLIYRIGDNDTRLIEAVTAIVRGEMKS